MAVCIIISRSLNRGGGLSREGKCNSVGRDSVSIKLYGYQQYLYY